MVIVGLLLPVRAWFAEFEAYVHSLGAIGPVIYALGYVALTVLLFPASFVTLGAGTLFGLRPVCLSLWSEPISARFVRFF